VITGEIVILWECYLRENGDLKKRDSRWSLAPNVLIGGGNDG